MVFYLIGMNDEIFQTGTRNIDWEHLCLETKKLDTITESLNSPSNSLHYDRDQEVLQGPTRRAKKC